MVDIVSCEYTGRKSNFFCDFLVVQNVQSYLNSFLASGGIKAGYSFTSGSADFLIISTYKTSVLVAKDHPIPKYDGYAFLINLCNTEDAKELAGQQRLEYNHRCSHSSLEHTYLRVGSYKALLWWGTKVLIIFERQKK